MLSILQIDSLGKRYGKLPSEIIKKADTFDLYIMDAALSFEQYHHKKAMNKCKPVIPDYSQEQLQNIFNNKKLNND
jgi:hypothetical protein